MASLNRTFVWSARLVLALSLVLAINVGIAQAAQQSGSSAKKPAAKNVIVMISDGRTYSQIDVASIYQNGKTGSQVFEHFPFQFGMSTYSWDGMQADPKGYDPAKAWASFDYVKAHYTDSASSATAMATGVKTWDRAIGVDPNDKPVKNVVERAEELGKSTGVVTSVEWSHATPAGFVAHNVNRDDYKGISEEMAFASKVDVIMGAGNPTYDNSGKPAVTPDYKYIGKDTWTKLMSDPTGADADGDGTADAWTVIQDRSSFRDLMSGPTPKRVLGTAQIWETLQQRRAGDAMANPYVVPFVESVPTLTEMTLGALNVLDDDPDGFFLMVEGGAIDWADSSNQPGRMIEEQVAFHDTVESVVKWVERNSNWGETLLIVTSDHDAGYVTGPNSGQTASGPVWNPIANNGAGNLPGFEFHAKGHTNSLVPIYAKGDAGRFLRPYADQFDPVRGRYIDNTEMARVLFAVMEAVD